MVRSINHIGIAVRSIDEMRAFYEDVLGARYEGEETVPDQGVRVGFFLVGDVRLELLEPIDDESPVARFIERRGPGLHHIACAVDDLDARIAQLKTRGVRLIDEDARSGAHHMRIAFLHPKASGGVLTELCQPVESNEG